LQLVLTSDYNKRSTELAYMHNTDKVYTQ